MIDTKAKLLLLLKLRYRFLKTAANELGFTSSKEYQRFRSTILGASRNIQVINKLNKTFQNLDTNKIWAVQLNELD